MNNAPHGPGDTAGYIGRYALQELLGKGAMGEVYRAILHGPAGFQKTVALKVLLPSITTRNTDFRATLTNEARLGGLLKHPNVVETYELGEESDLLYIAMEYVAGPTLSRVMRRWKPIPTLEQWYLESSGILIHQSVNQVYVGAAGIDVKVGHDLYSFEPNPTHGLETSMQ